MPGSELDRGTWSLLILQTLQRGRLHGYGIAASIKDLAKGGLEPEQGVLYPTLRRMEKAGWIRGEWGITDTGRRAYFYEITGKGEGTLRKKRDSWKKHVEAVSAVLGGAEA